MTRILGYADRVSAAPGERLSVMVSCEGLEQYDARLIRVIHGDVNPAGPGYREHCVPLDLGGPFAARFQPIHAGSYAVVDNPPGFDSGRSLSAQALIWPTLCNGRPQTIMSQIDPQTDLGFRLYLDSEFTLNFEICTKENEQASVSTGIALLTERWCLVSGCYDAEASTLSVSQFPVQKHLNIENSGKRASRFVANLDSMHVDAPILIAARPESARPASEHFNGRIESPKLFARALSADEMQFSTDASNESLIGAWDFSIGIPSDQITDVSGHELHGYLVNLPTRAVAGCAWNGKERCWQNQPSHYAAIHFHDDDLYDCDWDVDFQLVLPSSIASGVYAIHLHSGSDEYYIPFAVRAPRGTTTSPVAFLMPTASYMAYANNRIGLDVPETEIVTGRLLQLHSTDLFMQEHPEIGLCFYDLHNDGSGVFYSSRLRPVINMQPKHIGNLGGTGSNVWQFNADTHILNWLDQTGQSYDVITDEDLEAEGVRALEGYRVTITGTHPEYYSAGMLDSLQSFLNEGGRLMYLGGNGFYWRVSYHPTLPGVIECRKSEDGIRAFAPLPGEFYASFTGEYTGLWRRNGRAPNQLVGVGMVSQGFDRSSPYILREASRDPRAAFIFDGVAGPVVGDYGLSGGAAAGLELDATDHSLGTPPNAMILASSEQHTDLYLVTPEDMNDPAPGLGGTEAEIIRAELVFFETPAGGAVFSTGSIAWSGSLSHADYDNDIARITTNVLNRFVDATPFALPDTDHRGRGTASRSL